MDPHRFPSESEYRYSLSRRDPDPGAKQMRNLADPDPGQTLKSKKLNFYMKNILKVGSRSKNIPT